jgi:hypothetical protein
MKNKNHGFEYRMATPTDPGRACRAARLILGMAGIEVTEVTEADEEQDAQLTCKYRGAKYYVQICPYDGVFQLYSEGVEENGDWFMTDIGGFRNMRDVVYRIVA